MDRPHVRRMIVAAAAALAVAAALAIRHTRSPGLIRAEKTFQATGTFVTLAAWASDEKAAAGAVTAGEETVARIEGLLSHFKPDSDISRLNRAATGTAVPVSPETLDRLERAADISRLTGGAFDVTVGPLVLLWKDAAKSGMLPTDAQIAEARSRVGWQSVSLEPVARTATLTKEGMYVDLSSVSKGYIMDRAAAAMRAAGADAGFANGGGDIAFFGKHPDGHGWRVGVADPRSPTDVVTTLVVEECGVVTSGNYEQSYEIAGRMFSHIIDARTGWPLEGSVPPASVTIVAPTAAAGSGWSTALSVLGREGAKPAEDDGIDFLMYFADGRKITEFQSAGMARYRE